jgi:hypothetical protein
MCCAPIIATNKAVDFVIRHEDRLVSVQVKKATLWQHKTWAEPRVTACLHGSAPRAYKQVDGYSRADLVDFFALVCMDLNTIWLIPESEMLVKQTWSRKRSQLRDLDPYVF